MVRQKGFSLFELVIVLIICLLILLLISPAIEKALEIAHEHSLRTTARAFKKSVEIGHQLYILSGKQGPIKNLPRFLDGTVDFNKNGYPIGSILSEEGDTPSSDMDCIDTWNAVLGPLRPIATVHNQGQYQARYHFQNSQPYCKYEYQAQPTMYILYNLIDGDVKFRDNYGSDDKKRKAENNK